VPVRHRAVRTALRGPSTRLAQAEMVVASEAITSNEALSPLENRPSEATGAVLRYPISATAAEKPLRHKGQESFPSWTSPVRPRSPALIETLGNTEGFFADAGNRLGNETVAGPPQAEPEGTRKFRRPGGARASRAPS